MTLRRCAWWALLLVTLGYLAVVLVTVFPRHHTPLADVPLPRSGASLTVAQRATVVGYERSAFGDGWAPAGACTTREATIIRQQGPDTVSDCRVRSAGRDPYSGTQLDPAAIDIDHVFPLSAAWDMGAYAWPAHLREQFANDPLNLVAVSRKENREKSDALPSEWMPSDRGARCWYSRRLDAVARSYHLPLTRADRAVMRWSCFPSGME